VRRYARGELSGTPRAAPRTDAPILRPHKDKGPRPHKTTGGPDSQRDGAT